MPNCNSCSAPIIWATNARTGRKMPLNAEPDPVAGNVLVCDGTADVLREHDAAEARANGVKLHLSHFATCPAAEKHRRPA